VSRLSIVVKLSCGTEEVEGVCSGLDTAAEYVSVEFSKGGGGRVVVIGCKVCCWTEFWVSDGITCCC